VSEDDFNIMDDKPRFRTRLFNRART